MRDAVSSMRVSTPGCAQTGRWGSHHVRERVHHVGDGGTQPVGPPLKISCSWLSAAHAPISPALTDPAAAAWRVSSSLWLRKMVRISTPCPM